MNPLLAPWTGPFGGVPPFGRFDLSDLEPALDRAMAEKLAAIEAIAHRTSAPTFDDTLGALERAGAVLDRVLAIYGVYTSTLSDARIQAIERATAPKLVALEDRIMQNARLFARVEAVHEGADRLALTPEQRRLAWVVHRGFVRSGARLDGAAKARLFDLNQRLATHHTTFRQNLLAEENEQFVLLERDGDLAGLPASLRVAAAEAAAARGREGRWAIVNTRSSVDPFLTHSTRRDLREKVWRMFTSRGEHGDARDNRALVTEILRLRAERATLLGYPTHAHLALEDSMAGTPERALALVEATWKPAVARVREEVADMQALADAEEGRGAIAIAPWDYRHYAERVRSAGDAVDAGDVTPYLQLEALREGMFWVAGELFGLRFAAIGDGSVPTARADIRVFQVSDAEGRAMGLWYFDPYARAGKSSGAWMSEYRAQSRFDGRVMPIVSNNANFVAAAPGEAVLVSWDDARTLFHEFGHALHGLCSDVAYPSLAGTAVARDYVEFPSQLLERWLPLPKVLERFARHHRTGEPLPAGLAQKLGRSERHAQGFATVEYLASALVDLRMHLTPERVTDPDRFERETLAAAGMPAEIAMRHRPPHFAHVFAGDGYAAAYYSYLWAETLSADGFEAFLEGDGPFDAAVAGRLRDAVFRVGNTVDPAAGYRAFRGRDPTLAALMRQRGFPVPAATGAAEKASADEGSVRYHGSCLCRGVAYEVTGELGDFGYCHCTSCRKASGTAHAANAPVDRVAFRFVRGDELLREFESSPGKFRAFCSRCGSPLYAYLAATPGVLRLRLGSLDTPFTKQPRAHTFVSDKAPWDPIGDGIPEFPGWAPKAVLHQRGSRQGDR
jgi:peptidyl-dipeptidase Dcp